MDDHLGKVVVTQYDHHFGMMSTEGLRHVGGYQLYILVRLRLLLEIEYQIRWFGGVHS